MEVAPEAVITVVFDEPVDPDSFDSGFSLIGPVGNGDRDVPGTRETLGDGSRFVFTPADAQASAGGLVAGESYTLSVSPLVTDLAGWQMELLGRMLGR